MLLTFKNCQKDCFSLCGKENFVINQLRVTPKINRKAVKKAWFGHINDNNSNSNLYFWV